MHNTAEPSCLDAQNPTRRKASTTPTITQTDLLIPAIKSLLPHLAGQNLKRAGETNPPATTPNPDAAAVVTLLQATAT